MGASVKKLVIQFAFGVLFSFTGLVFLWALRVLCWRCFQITFLGSMGDILIGMLIVAPVGSIVGIIFANKRFYPPHRLSILGSILAFILGGLGGYLGFYLVLDKVKGFTVLILFVSIVVVFSLIGYNLRLILGQKLNGFQDQTPAE